MGEQRERLAGSAWCTGGPRIDSPCRASPSRNGFTLIETLLVLAVLVIIAAILFPIFAPSRESDRPASCQSNLKNITLGFRQYLVDYYGVWPPATGGASVGWADDMQPYLKSVQIFQCPKEPNPPSQTLDPHAGGYTDYWYNAALGRKSSTNFNAEALTICAGDGNDGTDNTDASYSLRRLPAQWVANPASPAYRHLAGANYGFADGHVKWLKPALVKNQPVAVGSPTFSYR